VKDNTGQLLNR